jgi:hypothetical protein
MHEQARHRVALFRVDVLGHGNKPDREFLDALDQMGEASAPAVKLPHHHGIELAPPGVLHQSIKLRP